jgi:hypothetical protein
VILKYYSLDDIVDFGVTIFLVPLPIFSHSELRTNPEGFKEEPVVPIIFNNSALDYLKNNSNLSIY